MFHPGRFTGMGLLFSWVFLFAACIPSSRGAGSQFALGTVCTVNAFEKGNPELYYLVFSRLRELEDIFSANKDDTDLDLVNKNAGLAPVRVRPELIAVLEKAVKFAEKSNGFFDPTVGPLIKLWGIGTDTPRVPGEEEIRKAQELISYKEIEIDKEGGTVFLKRSGMALDLGAIAKGYAADDLARFLAGEGVERAIIDLGGDIFAMGEKPGSDGTYWRIGIQDPKRERGSYFGIVSIKNKSVVTSGTYERFFEKDGKHYHHIFSIESGFPVENGLLSVTVVSDECADADALSTAAFALGWEKGRELIEGVKGAAGVFVFDDLTVRMTEGLEGDFVITAAEYKKP